MSRIILTVLAVLSGFACARAASFIHADMELANNAVLSMYQDSYGCVWVGTYDGLHMYNGKDTYVFRMDLDNEMSLCSNIVVNIVPAETDYIWIATSLGINKFSIKERRVTGRYMMYAEIDDIISDTEGNTLLFMKKDFISCYNPDTDRFEDVFVPGTDPAAIVKLWSDRPGDFCMLTVSGDLVRYRFDSMTRNIATVSESKISEETVTQAFYSDFKLYFSDARGRILRSYFDGSKVDLIADFSTAGDAGHYISSICEYKGYIYIGSFSGGFFRMPDTGGRCEMLADDYRIFCIMGDSRQNIVWVGTDGYGTYMYCEKTEPFCEIVMSDLPHRVMKPVRAVHADAAGDLWIGTKGDGLIRISDYDHADGKHASGGGSVSMYTWEEGLSAMEVFSFCPDEHNGLLWIGTAGPGLSYYSYKKSGIGTVDCPVPQVGTGIRNIHQMCLVDGTRLFMASDNTGLLELGYHISDGEPAVDSLKCYRFMRDGRHCNDFYAITPESDSTILLGMKGGYGLIRFNFRTGEYGFVDMDSLQSHAWGDILCIYKSDISGIFCGSSSGLIRIMPDGKVKRYGNNEGLLNTMIHGVLEDSNGSIWLSTNKGLSQFNPENEFFHNWSLSDLRVLEFSDDAYSSCRYDGKLFFGGVNGVVWVDPSVRVGADYSAPMLFMDLSLPDKTVPLSDYNLPDEDKPYLVIPDGVSRFSVSFVAVDYLNGENNEYSYRLSGSADSTWTELQKENKVILSNLSPGRYNLEVRYKNDVTDSHVSVRSLPLRIMPPWYGSTAAFAGYFLAGMAIIFFIVAWTRRHYRLKQKMAMERMEEEQNRKLYEARLNFFVNISHELCSPLTVINGMAERLSEHSGNDPQMRKWTEVLSNNVRGLDELVQEILDFRQIEEYGFGHVKIRSTDMGEILKVQMESYNDIAQRNGIQMQLIVPPVLVWNTDKGFFKKIVFNLFSNALKYTPVDGVVTIESYIDSSGFVLKIRNTGKGIPADKLRQIFDRYKVLDDMDKNMYTDTASRHGLGLFICHELVKALNGTVTASSEVGKWTEFTVVLPYQEEDTSGNGTDTVPRKARQGIGRPYIMVVEDNRDISWLISSSLSDEYDVVSFSSVEEAIASIEDRTPDLVVTDIVMPGKDGLYFVRRLRSDKYLRGIPVVVVSAKVAEHDQVEGFASGADAYLTKPFSVSVLKATVGHLLLNRKLLKEYFTSPESSYSSVDGHKMHQSDKVFLSSVVDVLRKHLSEEALTIDVLAGELGMTARGFYRKFKKISGKAPSEFIKEFRFRSAAELLKTTDLTVQEIMYKVGIMNKSYFYREFMKIFGVKPKEYRDAGEQ